MAEELPLPISIAEERRRWRRVQRLAKKLGFEGEVEYRHVPSRTGGAQYQIGSKAELDRLVVFARAFQRDADPEDFSLPAILAHERGHQLLNRHSLLRQFLNRWQGPAAEEIMASVAGSLLNVRKKDQQDLMDKAVDEALKSGIEPDDAVWLATELFAKFKEIL
jgi:hypothetical protein